MSYELIAQGSLIDATEISGYENYVEEEQKARLQLDLRSSISSSVASQLLNELKQHGVTDATVTTGDKLVTIGWRKGMPWLAVILTIILAIIVLAILIVGWRLYKEVGTAAGNSFFIGVGIFAAILAVIWLKGRQ